MTIDSLEVLSKPRQVLDPVGASKAAERILGAGARMADAAPTQEEAKHLRATRTASLSRNGG